MTRRRATGIGQHSGIQSLRAPNETRPSTGARSAVLRGEGHASHQRFFPFFRSEGPLERIIVGPVVLPGLPPNHHPHPASSCQPYYTRCRWRTQAPFFHHAQKGSARPFRVVPDWPPDLTPAGVMFGFISTPLQRWLEAAVPSPTVSGILPQPDTPTSPPGTSP